MDGLTINVEAVEKCTINFVTDSGRPRQPWTQIGIMWLSHMQRIIFFPVKITSQTQNMCLKIRAQQNFISLHTKMITVGEISGPEFETYPFFVQTWACLHFGQLLCPILKNATAGWSCFWVIFLSWNKADGMAWMQGKGRIKVKNSPQNITHHFSPLVSAFFAGYNR